MSESNWILKGVDPAIRDQAVAEAERLGVSLSDYLTDIVLKSAIADQLADLVEAETTQPEQEDSAIFAPPPESREGFAIRQRLKALERRLGVAISSLESANHGLDSSLFDVTARVGEVEALAGDTAHALGQTQQEVNNAVTGLQIHLAVIEDNIGDLGHVMDQRCNSADERLGLVERHAAVLADAHEALKHAVAQDFSAFAIDTTDRLGAGLAEVRAAADAAADQADAAVAHLIAELRGVREAIDHRMEQSAADTRARMHAAFADAADRLGQLSERVTDNERFTNRITDQLRAQIVDVEDGAQTALEETAAALRNADAVIAADLSRATLEQHAALENTRTTLSAELIAVREDQISALARLKLVDVAVGNALNEIADVREAADRGVADVRDALLARIALAESRAQEAQSNAQTSATARIDDVMSRLGQAERDTVQLRQTLLVEVERVETCTFASLEKLGRDVTAAETANERRTELAAQALRTEIERGRQQAAADIATLREDHAGVAARLTLLDGALNRVETVAAPLDARIAQLEAALAGAETEQALSVVRDDIATLAQRLDALRADTTLADRMVTLQSQLGEQAAQSSELSDKLQGLARMVNRVAAQGVESANRAEERAHQIDVAMADMRLSQLASEPAPAAAERAIRAFEQRVEEMEQRQVEALHTLRNDIARFVADNDRRLADLEAPDARDLASEFDSLRARIEERIIGVETRSIRTLEQVADTVAMLEQRFLQASEDLEAQARSA